MARRRRRFRLTTRGAKARLKWFRQESTLAVALTGMLLLLFVPGEAELPPEDGPAENQSHSQVEPNGQKSAEEALGTIGRLWRFLRQPWYDSV